MAIDNGNGLSRVVEMRWAAFVVAEAGSDPATPRAATRALGRLLAATPHGDAADATATDKLFRVLAALEGAIAECCYP